MEQRAGINYSQNRILLALYIETFNKICSNCFMFGIYRHNVGISIQTIVLYIVNTVIEHRQKHVTNFPFSFVYFIHFGYLLNYIYASHQKREKSSFSRIHWETGSIMKISCPEAAHCMYHSQSLQKNEQMKFRYCWTFDHNKAHDEKRAQTAAFSWISV